MTVDKWFEEFTKRAAPRFRDTLASDEQLPSRIAGILERLRQTESSAHINNIGTRSVRRTHAL